MRLVFAESILRSANNLNSRLLFSRVAFHFMRIVVCSWDIYGAAKSLSLQMRTGGNVLGLDIKINVRLHS